MPKQIVTMTEDDWIDKYKPVPAPVQGNGFDFGSGCTLVCLSETREFVALDTTPDDKIWTVVENDEVMTIVSGYHNVNRIGFIITQEAFDENEEINVTLDV